MTSPVKRNLKEYINVVKRYTEAATRLAGKPQKLSVVGDFLYWTQGQKQELYRVSTKDVAATGEPVIVVAAAAAEDKSAASATKLTKEEELLRERTRSLVTGISSYHVRKADGAVFYTSGVDLFVYYQSGPLAQQGPFKVFDHADDAHKARVAEQGGKPNLFIQFVADSTSEDGLDFSRLTFVNNNNVYLAELTETGSADAPLSVQVKPVTTIGDDVHQCGIADYIIQEEFDRLTGHYGQGKHILYSYTDMSMMRHIALLKGRGAGDKDDDDTERMAYSRVGDPNARATIVAYDTETGVYRYLPHAALVKAAESSAAAFSNVEYIPRFGFKDDAHVYVSLLNRTQQEMAIVSFPIDALPEIDESGLQQLYSAKEEAKEEGALDCFTVEWSQSIPWAWVDVMPGPPIHFGAVYDITLCAAAETPKAHYHLYYRPSGEGEAAWRPLTSGDWNVKAGTVRVMKENNAVAFLANLDGRLESTLFSATLPSPDFAEAVAAPVSSEYYVMRHSGAKEHAYPSFSFDANAVYFVASSFNRPAELVSAALDRRQEIRTIPTEPWLVAPPAAPKEEGADAAAGADAAPADDDKVEAFVPAPHKGKTFSLFGNAMVIPTVITVPNRRGVPLSAHLFCAEDAAPSSDSSSSSSNGRPLVVFVYGGPHVQLVTAHDFDACCRATIQALVQQGMNVAVVDNQQAVCNGLRDLSICKKNMGHYETGDYCDVVAHITGASEEQDAGEGENEGAASSAALPAGWRVDPARVAIFGWSYGGYATLLAMSQAPDVFKIGFAGAPVGDWTLYDTGYTERYMGLLHGDDENTTETSEAYAKSTIASFVDGFPDELNRVFIAHGLLDENVHFLHTAHVLEAMVAAGKPYSTLVYPGERHGLRQNKASRPHHEAMLLKTLVELL